MLNSCKGRHIVWPPSSGMAMIFDLEDVFVALALAFYSTISLKSPVGM